jgi:hypothetical protein
LFNLLLICGLGVVPAAAPIMHILAMGWHVIFAWQACVTRMANISACLYIAMRFLHGRHASHTWLVAMRLAQGSYASRTWLLFAARRHASASAGAQAHVPKTDRPDRGDDDDGTMIDMGVVVGVGGGGGGSRILDQVDDDDDDDDGLPPHEPRGVSL